MVSRDTKAKAAIDRPAGEKPKPMTEPRRGRTSDIVTKKRRAGSGSDRNWNWTVDGFNLPGGRQVMDVDRNILSHHGKGKICNGVSCTFSLARIPGRDLYRPNG